MPDYKIHRIEIDFALPVALSNDDMKDLDYLVNRICKANKPEGWCFWRPSSDWLGTGGRQR